jgi:hypothetical protein
VTDRLCRGVSVCIGRSQTWIPRQPHQSWQALEVVATRQAVMRAVASVLCAALLLAVALAKQDGATTPEYEVVSTNYENASQEPAAEAQGEPVPPRFPP